MHKTDPEMPALPYVEQEITEAPNIVLDSKLVVDSYIYTIRDLQLLDADGITTVMTVSETALATYQRTRGHSHADQDELYFFLKGEGDMQVGGSLRDTKDARIHRVRPGSVVYVKAGRFHRVFNRAAEKLVFYAIFAGKSERPALF